MALSSWDMSFNDREYKQIFTARKSQSAQKRNWPFLNRRHDREIKPLSANIAPDFQSGLNP